LEPWKHYRAQVAALSRDRAADDPKLVEARRALAAERLAVEIRRKAPGLTDAQRVRLVSILAGVA
jgi:hypothetical protein